MRRRELIKALGAGALASAAGACAKTETSGATATTAPKEIRHWKMVTSWPPNFPGLGTGANFLANAITQMSGGRIKVKVYAARELVPAFEVFDAVSRRTAELGHSAAYYWKGKSEAAQFFAAVPFGLTAEEIDGWFYYGDGLDLWREVYEPFSLIPMPAGHSGVQMGGWFNREINSVNDLKGLKMRIPGLGGEVLRRAGGTPVNLPGSELFTALQTGTIDATEWVGPYNDLAFGLYQAAKYYYYPGWHEPNAVLECLINKKAFESLPEDLQAIVMNACRATSNNMLSEFAARNSDALVELVNTYGVELRRFPDAVLDRLRALTDEVLGETAARDPLFAKVYASYSAYQQRSAAWQDVSILPYLQSRGD